MADPTLHTGAAQLGHRRSSERQARQLLQLLDELDDWNQRMNLTAIRERGAQVTKHLLDSLSMQPYLHGARIAGHRHGRGISGTAAGHRAIRSLQFTLLDSTAKKLKFIDHVAQLLGVAQRAQRCIRAPKIYRPAERFDIVMSRAVGPVEQFVKWSGHLCVGGGRLLAMKGRDPAAEAGEIAERMETRGGPST